ncbi:hypothetical protein LCGC14_1570870, partial [marine sediment metagenome]
ASSFKPSVNFTGTCTISLPTFILAHRSEQTPASQEKPTGGTAPQLWHSQQQAAEGESNCPLTFILTHSEKRRRTPSPKSSLAVGIPDLVRRSYPPQSLKTQLLTALPRLEWEGTKLISTLGKCWSGMYVRAAGLRMPPGLRYRDSHQTLHKQRTICTRPQS